MTVFTLQDVVSYNNQTQSCPMARTIRTATSRTTLFNFGAEGATKDKAILAARNRQKRNLLATTVLAIGTPMLLMGDEFSRSQGGNNNAYCQDNETSWMAWVDKQDPQLVEFVGNLISLRKSHEVFRRLEFFNGNVIAGRVSRTFTGSARPAAKWAVKIGATSNGASSGSSSATTARQPNVF